MPSYPFWSQGVNVRCMQTKLIRLLFFHSLLFCSSSFLHKILLQFTKSMNDRVEIQSLSNPHSASNLGLLLPFSFLLFLPFFNILLLSWAHQTCICRRFFPVPSHYWVGLWRFVSFCLALLPPAASPPSSSFFSPNDVSRIVILPKAHEESGTYLCATNNFFEFSFRGQKGKKGREEGEGGVAAAAGLLVHHASQFAAIFLSLLLFRNVDSSVSFLSHWQLAEPEKGGNSAQWPCLFWHSACLWPTLSLGRRAHRVRLIRSTEGPSSSIT